MLENSKSLNGILPLKIYYTELKMSFAKSESNHLSAEAH